MQKNYVVLTIRLAVNTVKIARFLFDGPGCIAHAATSVSGKKQDE